MFKLLLVVILSYISLSDACSCIPLVKKDAYCRSKFAGVIKVLSSTSCGTMQTCYSIQIYQQIRGATSTATVLKTNNSSAACGVTLIPGNYYFVATDPYDANTLTLSLCQLNENWTNITFQQYVTNIDTYRSYRCYTVVGPIEQAPIELKTQ